MQGINFVGDKHYHSEPCHGIGYRIAGRCGLGDVYVLISNNIIIVYNITRILVLKAEILLVLIDIPYCG